MLLCTSSLTRQCDVFNASTPGHPPHPKSHTLTELVFLSNPPHPFPPSLATLGDKTRRDGRTGRGWREVLNKVAWEGRRPAG